MGLGATGFVHGRRDVQRFNFLYHSEVGYVHEQAPIDGHWFRYSLGAGAGTPQLHLRYSLAFLGGRDGDQGSNIGWSHGAVADLIGGLVALELGQQRMRGESPRLYAVATTNLFAVAFLIRSLAGRR